MYSALQCSVVHYSVVQCKCRTEQLLEALLLVRSVAHSVIVKTRVSAQVLRDAQNITEHNGIANRVLESEIYLAGGRADGRPGCRSSGLCARPACTRSGGTKAIRSERFNFLFG